MYSVLSFIILIYIIVSILTYIFTNLENYTFNSFGNLLN